VSRETSALATVAFLMGLVASAFGQVPQIQPRPALPANVLGPQLIMWSQLQQPRPMPQPLPDPPEQQPEQQPAQQQAGQSSNSQAEQQPAAQTFTGTIMKDGSKKDGTKYVLKSNGMTYQLDDQDKAKQYEGKQVKIVGNLDANNNTLHIASIEAMP
jgi:Protein of unknown function (DUF5818)